MKGIGERIRNVRQRYGLTQTEFAAKLFVSFHTVSKWELENNQPTLDDIDAICRVYHVSPNELFGYHSNTETPS